MQHQMLNTLHKHPHFVNKEEGKSALHVSISSISAQPKPHLRWSEVKLPEVTSSEVALTSIYFSSIFSISFRYSIYLSSIFSLSFHYSTYFSSVFSKSFHYSTYFSSVFSKSFHYSTYFSSFLTHSLTQLTQHN